MIDLGALLKDYRVTTPSQGAYSAMTTRPSAVERIEEYYRRLPKFRLMVSLDCCTSKFELMLSLTHVVAMPLVVLADPTRSQEHDSRPAYVRELTLHLKNERVRIYSH